MIVKQDQEYSQLHQLHPNIIKFVEGLQNKTATGIDWKSWETIRNKDGDVLRIVDSFRTFEDQYQELQKGRPYLADTISDMVAKKSTNAKPGESFHNWYLAIDIIFARTGFGIATYNGKVYYPKPTKDQYGLDQFYIDTGIVQWAKKCQVRWGGAWVYPDIPDINHFETFKLPVNSFRKSENAVSGWWTNKDAFKDDSLLGKIKSSFKISFGFTVALLLLFYFSSIAKGVKNGYRKSFNSR